jgi:hypothetical protein
MGINEKMTGKLKIQSLKSLREEMIAIAKGTRPAPRDAKVRSFNLPPTNRILITDRETWDNWGLTSTEYVEFDGFLHLIYRSKAGMVTLLPQAENTEYTVEDGKVVFTAEYLRSRGKCCGNGCKNCPYTKES